MLLASPAEHFTSIIWWLSVGIYKIPGLNLWGQWTSRITRLFGCECLGLQAAKDASGVQWAQQIEKARVGKKIPRDGSSHPEAIGFWLVVQTLNKHPAWNVMKSAKRGVSSSKIGHVWVGSWSILNLPLEDTYWLPRMGESTSIPQDTIYSNPQIDRTLGKLEMVGNTSKTILDFRPFWGPWGPIQCGECGIQQQYEELQTIVNSGRLQLVPQCKPLLSGASHTSMRNLW